MQFPALSSTFSRQKAQQRVPPGCGIHLSENASWTQCYCVLIAKGAGGTHAQGPIEVAPKYLFLPLSAFIVFFFCPAVFPLSNPPEVASQFLQRQRQAMRLLVLAFSLGSVVLALRILSHCFSFFVAIVRTSLLSASSSLFLFLYFFSPLYPISLPSLPYPGFATPVHKTRKEEVPVRLGSSGSLVSSFWPALFSSSSPNHVSFFSFPSPHLLSVFLFTSCNKQFAFEHWPFYNPTYSARASFSLIPPTV